MRRIGLVSGIVAGVLVLASPALAAWGEDWGTMAWEATPVGVPTLGLLGVGLLVLLLGISTVGFLRGRSWVMASLFVLLAVPLAAAASTIVGLNIFANGQPADAEEVNENFEIVKVAVNENVVDIAAAQDAASAAAAGHLDEAAVDAFVSNNGYSTGAHTVDTTLDEAAVDAFVSNNGYSTGAHTVDTTLDEAAVDAFVSNNGYSTGAHTVDTTLDEAAVDAFVDNNGYATATAQGPHDRGNPGNQATAVGVDALLSNEWAGGNTAVGYRALKDNTYSEWNTAVGAFVLENQTYVGWGNTGVGTYALRFNTTGSGNVAIGHDALNQNTEGGGNVAAGHETLVNNSTGGGNVGLGANALYQNYSGSKNIGLGGGALYNNTSGSYNIAIGNSAMLDNPGASHNIAIGNGALLGYFNFSGTGNVAIGNDAGSATDGDDNILIGHIGVASEDGTIRIGTPGTHTETHLAGDTTVSGSVDIEGDLEISGTVTTPATTRYRSIGGGTCAYAVDTPIGIANRERQCDLYGTSESYWPVSLPHGATITGFQVYSYGQNTTTTTCHLSYGTSNNGISFMQVTDTTEGWAWTTEATSPTHVVGNDVYSYVATCKADAVGAAGLNTIGSLRIRYTVASLLP